MLHNKLHFSHTGGKFVAFSSLPLICNLELYFCSQFFLLLLFFALADDHNESHSNKLLSDKLREKNNFVNLVIKKKC